MVIVKGSIYRNVSESEAKKYKQQGYTEAEGSGVKNDANNRNNGRKARKGQTAAGCGG